MSDEDRTILDRLTLQAKLDLGRTVPELPEPDEPVEEDKVESKGLRAAYREWLAKRPRATSPEIRRAWLQGQLETVERRIDRKIENIKHAPSDLDRDRAERNLAVLEEHAAQLRDALGLAAFTWDEAFEAEASAVYCRAPECGVQLESEQEAFRQSGLCRPCFQAWTGQTTTRKGDTR